MFILFKKKKYNWAYKTNLRTIFREYLANCAASSERTIFPPRDSILIYSNVV